METYLLLNGETLNVHWDIPAGTDNIELVNKVADTNFFLIAEMKGKMVGLLTIKRGQKLKTTYIGDLEINVHCDHLRIGIEKVLFQCLARWFNKMEAVRKVHLKVKVNSLMKLELLIDMCMIQQETGTVDFQLFQSD